MWKVVFTVEMFILAVLIFFSQPANAAPGPILNDTFTNTDYVSYTQPNVTTAYVSTNPNGGYVSLSQQPQPNAIAVKPGEDQYTIATAHGFSTYSYDDATNAMALNSALSASIQPSDDPIGVAVEPSNPDVWAATGSSLSLYAFNGSGMATSPDLQVTGLTNVISVTAWSQNGVDTSAALSKSGQVSLYSAGVNGVAPGITFNSGVTDPVAISVLAGTPNLVIATKTALYYYDYDDAIGNYDPLPSKTVTGLSGVLSVSAQQTGTADLTNSAAQYYLENDQGGPPLYATALSTSPVNGAVAFSIKPGTYDYAILGQDGDVKYYSYNDASQSETENPALEVSGVTLNSSLGYDHPEDYCSTTLTTSGSYDTAFLSVNYGTGLPAGTSVQWWVSSDGGTTWAPVNPGGMVYVTPGNQWVVHGLLDTTVPTSTPKIYGVTLTVDSISGLVISPAAIGPAYPNSSPPISGIQAQATFSGGSQPQDVTGLVQWAVTQNPTLVQPGAVVAYVYDYTTTSNSDPPGVYVLTPSGGNDGTADVYSGPYVGTADITASWSPGNGENFNSNTSVVTIEPDIPQSGVSGFIEIYRREVPN